MPEKIATIIGGQGYIGRALAIHLQAGGWRCHVAPRHQSWPRRGEALGTIFYCAGLTGDFYARPQDTVEAHVGLLARVLQSDRWDSLVYLSSTRLYDDLPPGAVATESMRLSVSPLQPRHLFDLTKLAGESVCMAMGQGRARVARLASVYGSVEDAQGFLPALVRQVRAAAPGSVIPVDSSADGERDYVYLPDVLGALESIASRGTQPIYNVAMGGNTRNASLGAWIGERAGRRVEFMREPLGRPAPRVDTALMQAEFGWKPTPVEQVVSSWLDTIGKTP